MANVNQSPIEPLPTEIISQILDHLVSPHAQSSLYACSLVNKKFHAIANPLLWRFPITTTELIRQRLLTSLNYVDPLQQPSPARYIQSLTFTGQGFTDDRFLGLLPHVPNLATLRLFDGVRVTDNGIQQLPHFCPHLTSLHLESIALSPSTFIALGHYCRQLRALYLRSCTMIQPNTLQPVVKNCPLEDLTLCSCPMNEETKIADIMSCHTVTHLELLDHSRETMKSLLLASFIPINSTSTTFINSETNTITTTTTNTPSTYPWANLKKFFFVECWDIDDTTWLQFIKTHPQIQDISIRDCGLTNASMVQIARWLPELTHVRFIHHSNITPQGIRQLACQAGPRLVSIRCNNCSYIGAGDFPEVTNPYQGDYSEDALVELDQTAMAEIRANFNNTNTNTNTNDD